MSARKGTSLSTPIRLTCSLWAIGSGWLTLGLYHILSSWNASNGTQLNTGFEWTSQDISFWFLWSGVFCGLGWLFVGLPIALTGRLLATNLAVSAFITGLLGVAAFLVPVLIQGFMFGGPGSSLGPALWWFCGTAFFTAAVTMIFYKLYVRLAERFNQRTI